MAQDVPDGSHTVFVNATTPLGQQLTLASFPITFGTLATTGSNTQIPTLGALLLMVLSGIGLLLHRRSL